MTKRYTLEIRIPGDYGWVMMGTFRFRWNARLSAFSLKDLFETRVRP